MRSDPTEERFRDRRFPRVRLLVLAMSVSLATQAAPPTLDDLVPDDLLDVGESRVPGIDLGPDTPPANVPDTGADPRLPDIGEASWIWSGSGALKGGGSTPAQVWFRKAFDLTEFPAHAAILITADNGYELYVNGQAVGSDLGYGAPYWQSIEKYDVSNMLTKGRNVIAVHATCLGGAAGLVAALRADFSGAPALEIKTDATWRAESKPVNDWQQAGMDDAAWPPAIELVPMGGAPWGMVEFGAVARPAPGAPGAVARTGTPAELLADPPDGFRWPAGILFVAGDCSLNGNGRTLFRVGKSKAWTQNDIPGPSLIGRRLMTLRPVRPDADAEVLFDAGDGLVGSPGVSYDGEWVYFSHMPAGESFYQVYRVPAAGGPAERLTHAPFHDFDPAELPDGRIVFSSTRMGTFEEYHSAPARGLFAFDPATRVIRLVTPSVVFDNEPRVMADGRIAFVRADNFGERAKVETRIHVVRPDGTGGITAFGPDRPPLRYDRARAGGDLPALLRNHGYGSPAPLPDGRVACLSHAGLLLSLPGNPAAPRIGRLGANQLCDISPLPDNRLLCTTAARDVIGVLDPADGKIVKLYRSTETAIHSVVYLGPRRRPPVLAGLSRVDDADPRPTGALVCQSVFNSRHRDLDWSRASAVRIYLGSGLTQRSSHSDIVHIGTEAVECGTVPLAPDGSFYVEVPADRAIAMQVVDAEGREIINELSWIYVRPGERRACIGCHAPRQLAPAGARGQAQALAWPPARLLGRGRPHRFRANNADNGGALNLQLERFREVASIDLYELDVVDGPGRRAEVQRLVEELAGGTAEERISAARRLAIHRDRSATPALSALVRDADREVRLNAAIALGACGDRTAVAGLTEALSDRDALVAQAARASLANITGQSVSFDPFAPCGRRGEREWEARLQKPWRETEEELIAVLDSSDPLERRSAVVALAHVGGPAGAAALSDRLARGIFSGDLRTALEAIRGLGHLAHGQAVDLLAGMLDVHREAPSASAVVRGKPKKADPIADEILRAVDESEPSTTLAEGLAADLLELRAKRLSAATPRPPPARKKRRPAVTVCHRAAAAAEALGRIGAALPDVRPKVEAALIKACEDLDLYSTYCGLYGDHSALHACHASPMHHRIAEALDAMAATNTAPIVPHLLRSMPTDPDRGLLLESDVVERITGRVVTRSGRAAEVIETCLSVLGDEQATPAADLADAVTSSPNAWAGNPRGEARAAQVLSAVCTDAKYGPRVLAVFERYRRMPPSPITTRLGNPGTIPTGHWVSFFLARALGRMKFAGAVDALIDGVARGAPEAAHGRPGAPGVHVLYEHNTMTPIWRAAAADALGRIGSRKAVPALLAAVADFDNATDVRAAAARALGRIADPAVLPGLRELAKEYPEISTRRELLAAIAKTAVAEPME